MSQPELYVHVLTDETILTRHYSDFLSDEMFSEMSGIINERKGSGFVYYGFSESDYLTFAQWLQEVLGYIKQQQEIIRYYENIARDQNTKLDDLETQHEEENNEN